MSQSTIISKAEQWWAGTTQTLHNARNTNNTYLFTFIKDKLFSFSLQTLHRVYKLTLNDYDIYSL